MSARNRRSQPVHLGRHAERQHQLYGRHRGARDDLPLRAPGTEPGRISHHHLELVQGRAAAGHTDIRTHSPASRPCLHRHARDNTSTTGTGVPIYWRPRWPTTTRTSMTGPGNRSTTRTSPTNGRRQHPLTERQRHREKRAGSATERRPAQLHSGRPPLQCHNVIKTLTRPTGWRYSTPHQHRPKAGPYPTKRRRLAPRSDQFPATTFNERGTDRPTQRSRRTTPRSPPIH